MARIKNAITGYFVDAWTSPAPSDATKELAKWISTVTDDSAEEVEQTAYYDGDGTLSNDITGITKSYTFEGMYDAADAGQSFIAGLEFKTGEDRKIAFKQVRSDGTSYFGKATVTEIKVTGGEASEYAPFQCTITWDNIPTATPPAPPSEG